MGDSILNEIKKMIGISIDDTSFDVSLINAINYAFFVLHDLGVGPNKVFNIRDSTSTWTEFNENDEPKYECVKNYVYLKVKLTFDPPNNSFLLKSIEDQLKEYEYRLCEASN